MTLPDTFTQYTRSLMGDELYGKLLRGLADEPPVSIRINRAKCHASPEGARPVGWCTDGWYLQGRPAFTFDPLLHAGWYYVQEASSMFLHHVISQHVADASLMLDLCAAPGGKATAAGAALQGQGLLVANDISTSRARALLRNLELFGIPNVFVANETPAKLTKAFPEFFDKIILDAPCSGEGMFRKEEALAKDWTPEKSLELSEIQKELILQAADMLRPDGLMLYSTCTFAPAEDEQTVSWLLENRPDMELAEMEDYEGFSHGVPEWGNGNPELIKCIRIFPHKMNGEGHFLALFHKKGQAIKESSRPHTKPDKNAFPLIEEFLNEIGLKTLCGQPFDWERVEIRGDKAYYLPPVAHNFRGITFLRNGLYLGDLKKNRFEPSQPLALAIRKDESEAVISLSASDERITRYLKGETLNIEPEEAAHKKGWHLLCADGYPIGFGKLVNQILKNKYPAGWRV